MLPTKLLTVKFHTWSIYSNHLCGYISYIFHECLGPTCCNSNPLIWWSSSDYWTDEGFDIGSPNEYFQGWGTVPRICPAAGGKYFLDVVTLPSFLLRWAEMGWDGEHYWLCDNDIFLIVGFDGLYRWIGVKFGRDSVAADVDVSDNARRCTKSSEVILIPFEWHCRSLVNTILIQPTTNNLLWSLTDQTKSIVVWEDSPSFFTISKATPNVNDAPLPPAIKITLSAVLTKFGVEP